MILNQELGLDEVRWAVMHCAHARTSYDTKESFIGIPRREQLDPPTVLLRLDYLPRGLPFVEVWWMREPVFKSLIRKAQRDPRRFRELAQDGHALPPVKSKPIAGGPLEEYERLAVTKIQLTQPVFAWVGMASALFGKSGGLEQVFLPNLHIRGNPRFSEHAVLSKTYWIRF